MGSAALHQVAKRGRRVLGLERYSPAHARGASHGRTRVIRQAYYESPAYVPLLRRAYELWAGLQAETAQPIWRRTGGLSAGRSDCEVVRGALASAREHGVPCELLDASDLRRRFPPFAPQPDEVGVFEPTMAALFPERCVLAQLQAAMRQGAEARFGASVEGWEFVADGGCELALADGARVRAARLIVCAGGWLESLFPARWPVRIERNVQHWFASEGRARPGTFPIFMLERSGFPHMFYGFPDFGDGLKAAFHGSGRFVEHPGQLERDVAPSEVERAREALDAWCPGLAGAHLSSTACTYTMTPDGHFILGALPELPVLVAAGFSGHGFKFAPLVGEVLADLALEGATAHSLALFDPARFG